MDIRKKRVDIEMEGECQYCDTSFECNSSDCKRAKVYGESVLYSYIACPNPRCGCESVFVTEKKE